MWRTHLDPKSKKKCILFSSIFNVDRPFQRYLLKTSGPGENNPITKRKNNFFSKFPRCKISTSTFSEIGNKKKINGFGVWSGPFFLTWVHLKGSVGTNRLPLHPSPLPLRGYYFDERPSCKTTAKFFFIYVAARNLSFGHFCWAVLEKQLF